MRRRHRRDELRVRRLVDDALQIVGVLRLHAPAVAIVPPVIDVVPRPLLDVEDVVADDGERTLEADLDSRDGRAHEGDGDDADDDAQGGQHGAHFVRSDDRERDAEGFGEFVEHDGERGMLNVECLMLNERFALLHIQH